jgi:hypothetical protein
MSAEQCRKVKWFYIFCLSSFDRMVSSKRYMIFRAIVYKLTNKTSIILICMIGVVAVSYGMLKDNILIFIIGLIFVFVGYLLIRRKIKKSVRKNP